MATEPLKIVEKYIDGHSTRVFKVAANAARIWKGTLVGINAEGNAVPASDTAGLKVVGIAAQTANPGDVMTVFGGRFEFPNGTAAPVDASMIDQPVYIEGDTAVSAAAGTNGIIAGILREIDIQTGLPVIDVGTLVHEPATVTP